MIEVQTLGRLRVSKNGREISSLHGQTLPLSVLVYVAVEREATREALIQIFWPGRDAAKAKHSLNQILHRLRRDLGDQWCISTGPLLRAGPSLSVDVVELHTASRQGRQERVLALYVGPFLVDFAPSHVDFEHWAEAKRASIGRTFRSCVRAAVANNEAEGELSRALEFARQWYDTDPEDDEAAHELIRITALSGDRHSALQVFDLFSRRLAEEGLRPLEQTEEMVLRIVRGQDPEPGDTLLDSRTANTASPGDATRHPFDSNLAATVEWNASPRGGPRLVRVLEQDQEAEAYILDARTVIGREEGDVLFPGDALLSTAHAAVYPREVDVGGGKTERRFVLQDLGSERGVFTRIRGPRPLQRGDVFMAGDQMFRADLE